MRPSHLRTAAMLAAFVLGGIFPAAHVASGLIRPLITWMLFLVFLEVTLQRAAFRRSHVWLVVANLAMAAAAYGAGLPWSEELALAGFFTALAPTAIAAASITAYLGGRVDYVVAAFCLSNAVVGALLPVLIPLAVAGAHVGLGDVAGRVFGVLLVPLLLALVVRRLVPGAPAWAARHRGLSFWPWVAVLFLATANAVEFVRTHPEIGALKLGAVAALSAVICAASFGLGRILGRPDRVREASQALGQKNTTLSLYFALTYAGPLVAMGPTFYVLFHNLYNSWQMYRQTRSQAAR